MIKETESGRDDYMPENKYNDESNKVDVITANVFVITTLIGLLVALYTLFTIAN